MHRREKDKKRREREAEMARLQSEAMAFGNKADEHEKAGRKEAANMARSEAREKEEAVRRMDEARAAKSRSPGGRSMASRPVKDKSKSPKTLAKAGKSMKVTKSITQSTAIQKGKACMIQRNVVREASMKDLEASRPSWQAAILQSAMPWLVLLAFTFCEMLATTLGNVALNITPTSIYVVFKSGKMVFVAIGSRLFLGAYLRQAQWVALMILVVALIISTIAESSPKTTSGGGL